MQTRIYKLRFRRHLRKSQRQVEDLSTQAEQTLDKHLIKRVDRLVPVRRFVIGWIGLMLFLIIGVLFQNNALGSYYQTLKPVPGGIYSEGVKGRVTNVNPIYASSDPDKTISRLVFAGLLKYDDDGKLIGDLAQSYSVDAKGNTYTIKLRPGLTWQDGQPLTSEDVVFTFQTIQNPDVGSPLQNGWKGVTITAPDKNTAIIKLPTTLASFPENLTVGLLPKHLLENVPATELRSADFNTVKPVGAGPFKWGGVSVEKATEPTKISAQVGLVPFKDYARGEPKLQKFNVYAYADEEELAKAFKSKQLYGAEGFTDMPAYAVSDAIKKHNITLRAANMVFFKTSEGVLADKGIRTAIVTGSNVPEVMQQINYKAIAVREPLLEGQLAYDPAYKQAGFNLESAKQQLSSLGWNQSKDGYRYKDGKQLSFGLVALNSAESHQVAETLKKQWQKLGLNLLVQYQDPVEFQNSVANHNYDSILNGITIGVDPDVFVYWDSSQADIRSSNRLNLSEYKNATADAALEAGRTRIDPVLRTIKYKPFLQVWQQDNPALGLYQPRFLYLSNGPVYGLSDKPISTATDRFNNVENWMIRQARVTDN